MTAYGRASLHSKLGHLTAEIQSVNRKFLEITIFLPKELARFESEIKKWLTSRLSRGQVTLRLFAAFDSVAPILVRPNIALANQIKLAWDEMAHELNLTSSDQGLTSILATNKDVLVFEDNIQDENIYLESLKEVIELSLKGFLQMKAQEGSALALDIMARIKKIQTWINIIEQKATNAPQKYREKLIARLEEVLPGRIENEEKILREVAVYAEKVDTTEEVTRFYAHLTQFESLVGSDDDNQVGKTLEFVLQEMGREINTIGSKSSDLEIARCVIDVKSELERIREQIQNVE